MATILPRSFALKSNNNKKYLRYIHQRIVNLDGLVQLSEEDVKSEYAKFQMEPADSDYGGLVHIKCCFNNKYLRRANDHQYWIVAGACEPEEDKKHWSCTLFEPVVVHSDNKAVFRLLHVQLGHFVTSFTVNDFNQCLFAETNTPNLHNDMDVYTVVDLEPLVLPKYWDLVETGYTIPKESTITVAQQQKLEEMKLKDLKKKYQGSARVKRAQLQALKRDFESLQMKNGESVMEYFARTMGIANKMRIYGDMLDDGSIVEKILRSMAPKFNYIVCSIEELRISEWMNQKGICIISPVEHAVQLDLIGKEEFFCGSNCIGYCCIMEHVIAGKLGRKIESGSFGELYLGKLFIVRWLLSWYVIDPQIVVLIYNKFTI
ncbi:hypothetical protein D8674_040817 [Pyrus ussuriensis x Pyrus communis]|uniref:Agglutinin domain-containing protein n=1 Tax=Pyrus ussuriensis x Pyrus communis TaxID=2448454 RepID=A0A5N5G495_9ROSA|nr:hypothetical protein D8674_040817 [Pyrus ussuriensis x Pyrus communis]